MNAIWHKAYEGEDKKKSERNIQVQKRSVDSEQRHTIVYQDFCKDFTKAARTSSP